MTVVGSFGDTGKAFVDVIVIVVMIVITTDIIRIRVQSEVIPFFVVFSMEDILIFGYLLLSSSSSSRVDIVLNRYVCCRTVE